MLGIAIAKRSLTATAAFLSIFIVFTGFGFYQWSLWSLHRARVMKALG